MEFILTFDNNVIKFVNEHMKSRVMDKIMRFVSALGNNGALWLGIAFGLILMGKEKRRIGTLMLLSLGLEASVCNLVIKPTVARDRPNDAHGLEITIDRPTDYSFPSGHTAAAFAAAASMYMSKKKPGIWMFYFAIVTGFSRIYLLVHYPIDVIAGAALGVVSAFTVNRIGNKKYKKVKG